ncbi:phosphopantetheine-binding protein [Tyzzerella sp. OttesenSCG-928-J15]|nr:phosphopantetheine-binding protein [Tyzzerella sp. OttesenSCG-928-J15]
MDEIKLKIREFLIETFDIDRDDDEFSDDVDFFTYGYVDSFGAAEIIAFMEKEFNIEVTNKDLVKYPMTSIDEIGKYIKQKLEG